MLVLSQVSMVLLLPGGRRGNSEVFIMCSMFVSGLIHTHLLRGVILGLRGRRITWAGLLLRLLPWILLFAAIWGTSLAKLRMMVIGDDFVIRGPRIIAESLSPAKQFFIMSFGIANAAFLIQCVWIGCYFMHHLFSAYQHSQLERLRIQASSREAEVRNLRRQMDPHFLFNSLNTVRALISPENGEARDALTHLSDLLRNSLRQSDKTLIPLREELAALHSHLAIEQLRFGPRLRFQSRIEAGLDAQPVPPFLIQTLVENAIKHGVARSEQGGNIILRVHACRSYLCCVVRNSGILDKSSDDGLGLHNIRTRLQLLYQGAATFHLRQRSPNQVRAAVCLPLRATIDAS